MLRVKGTVDKIWTNKTQAGKRCNVVEVGGARYSLLDGDYFDKIKQGQEIDFDYKESGNFKNIMNIYDGSEVRVNIKGYRKYKGYSDLVETYCCSATPTYYVIFPAIRYHGYFSKWDVRVKETRGE